LAPATVRRQFDIYTDPERMRFYSAVVMSSMIVLGRAAISSA
jgi:hypothetical protein